MHEDSVWASECHGNACVTFHVFVSTTVLEYDIYGMIYSFSRLFLYEHVFTRLESPDLPLYKL